MEKSKCCTDKPCLSQSKYFVNQRRRYPNKNDAKMPIRPASLLEAPSFFKATILA